MDSYAQREVEFGAEYERFEGADIVSLIVRTGEWLDTLLMNGDAVNATMRTLYERVIAATPEDVAKKGWRELWEGVALNEQMEPKVAQFLVGLSAFAFWGLRVDSVADGVHEVDECVARGRELLEAIPNGWGEVSDLRETVLAAEARLRLDTGRNVAPEQLAALARISLKTMKNMLTPKAGGNELHLDAVGEIARVDALRWLQAREGFRSSVWKEADAPREDKDLGQVLFVPVAKDGSWFDPVSCRRSGGYTIGPRGAEEPVHEYQEALARLWRMPVPYWRRPNSAGNWGIVAGISWQRKPLADLDIFASEAA